MVTYLWTKDNGGKTEYIGLNGQVYENAPEGNDLLGLQNLAQSYIGNENEYKLAFQNNVAHLLGESSSGYETYYNTNNTCVPGIDEIRCTVTENGGSTNVQTSLVIEEDKKILYFNFYNIKGEDGECDMNAYHIYYAYASSSSMPDTSTPIHSEFEEGDKWMGLQIVAGTRGESAIDYNWTNIQPNEAKARFVSYAFARQMSVPGTPAGGTYDNPVPTTPTGVWHESIPTNNTASVWMTKATFEEGTLGPISNWTAPVLMSDTTSFQVEWADSNDKTDAVFNHPEYLANLNGYISNYGETDIVRWEQEMEPTCGVWSNNATTSTTYMATCSLNNGSWGDWEVVKIKGESGKDGINGGRMFMIFAAIPSGVIPNAPESTVANWDTNNDTLNPSSFTSSTSQLGGYATWTTTTPTLADGELLWMSQAEFGYEENGKIKGAWSTPNRITGKDGINGADGSGIEFIYCRFPKLADYQTYIESAECSAMRNQESHPEYEGYPVTSRTQSDFIPENPNWQYHWTDSPLGVDLEHEIEACSTRREIITSGGIPEWGLFDIPIVWAARGADGIDGDGVEYIFRTTETAIETTTQMYGYRELTNPTPEEEDLCREHSVTYVPTDEEVDPEEDEEYIYDSVNNKFYHLEAYSVVAYSYPYDVAPEMPPQNFSESSKSGIFGPYYNDDEEHEHIELTEAQKQTLLTYYQENGFVPGREKISSDIQNEESAAYQQTWLLGGPMVHGFVSQGWCGGWVDSPVSVSPQRPFLWCATRKYTDDGNGGKSWQAFGEPFLWTQYAENGYIIFTSFAFTTLPEGIDISNGTPSGGTFTNPLPDSGTTAGTAVIWSDAPSGTGIVWMTSSIFSSEGSTTAGTHVTQWCHPKRLEDTSNFEVMYSPNAVAPVIPINFDPDSAAWWTLANSQGWYDDVADFSGSAVYMATIKGSNKVFNDNDWQVIKVKGEQGDEGDSGTDGSYTAFYFTSQNESIDLGQDIVSGGDYDHPAPTGTTPHVVNWADTPSTISGNRVIWMVTRRYSATSGETGNWSSPTRMVDTVDFEAAYSSGNNDGTYNPIPSGFDNSTAWWTSANTAGWYSDASGCTNGAIFMATINGTNGIFNDADWNIVKVKGDPGSIETLEYLTSAFTETQIDNQEGVLLREVIGVRDENEEVKAMLNASEHFSDETHGRVMFASGIDSVTPEIKSYAFAIEKIEVEEEILLLDQCFVTGGTYNSPLPTGTFMDAVPEIQDLTDQVTWLDSPRLSSSEVSGTDEVIVYITNKIFRESGMTPSDVYWQPIKQTYNGGTGGYDISIFSCDESYSEIPANFNEQAAMDYSNAWWSGASENGWFHTPLDFLDQEAIWMARTTSEDGVVFSDWKIIRIKQEPPMGKVSATTIIYEDGHLKTNSAEISGTITGSNVYGGRITGATINGGSLSIGNNRFAVDINGNFVSQNANMHNATINNATLNGNITLNNSNYLRLNDTSARTIVNISSGKVGVTTASTTSITNTVSGIVTEIWTMGSDSDTRYGELSTGGRWESTTVVGSKQGGGGDYSGETGNVELTWTFSMYKVTGDTWEAGTNPTIRLGSVYNYEGTNVTGETNGSVYLDSTYIGGISAFTSNSIVVPLRAKFESITSGWITINVAIYATAGGVEGYTSDGGEASASTVIELTGGPITIRRNITPESSYPTAVIGSNGIEVKTIGKNLLQYYLDDSGNTIFNVSVGDYSLKMANTGITATNANNKGFIIDGNGFRQLT